MYLQDGDPIVPYKTMSPKSGIDAQKMNQFTAAFVIYESKGVKDDR